MNPPFQYAGGKRSMAPYIWSRLGDVPFYVEPFAGSAAVLLARPTPPRDEILGDAWGFISNFWRAAKYAPDELAKISYFIPSEADLYARHKWLVSQAPELEQKLRSDPDWYDSKIAAWWGWGQNLWIMAGWCRNTRQQLGDRGFFRHQHVCGKRGVFSKRQRVGRELFTRPQTPADYLFDLLGRVEEGGPSVWQENLKKYFEVFSRRLERVNLFHGHWRRCVGKGVLNRGEGSCTAVFLDPTYNPKLCDSEKLYGVMASSEEVREWAVANGDRPDLRIVLCGYEGEHAMPENWTAKAWTNRGGGIGKRDKERLWFSPHCLPEF